MVPVLLQTSVNGDPSSAGLLARDSVARDSVGDSPLDEILLRDVNGPSAVESALLRRDDGMCSISGSPVVSRSISSSESSEKIFLSIGMSCGNRSCRGAGGGGIGSPPSLPLSSSSSPSASGTVGSSRSIRQ